jgi:hypothetical protein
MFAFHADAGPDFRPVLKVATKDLGEAAEISHPRQRHRDCARDPGQAVRTQLTLSGSMGCIFV